MGSVLGALSLYSGVVLRFWILSLCTGLGLYPPKE